MALALSLVAAYLLGSLVFGILYSRLRGADVRQTDFPGGSGIYRQYGAGAAVLVSGLDMLKGVAAVALTRHWAPGYEWAATFMVVLGHCYPAFFGLNGGGGIAPFMGAAALAAPRSLGLMALLAAVVMPSYRAFLQKKVGLNVIPFMALVVMPLALLLAYFLDWKTELRSVLAGAAAMGVRSLQWYLAGDWKLPHKTSPQGAPPEGEP